jgi:signal transduction histidine kinase
MIKIVDCIVDWHDSWLVVVAGLVCLLASYTSFSLLRHAKAEEFWPRNFWLAAAAVTMGSGVWATHFVAMLAYKAPWPIGYDVPMTALSAVIAIGISGVGMWLALNGIYALGGVIAGAAIASMHYTGMAALEGAFQVDWDGGYVVASVAIGVALSTLAFHLFPRIRTARESALVVVLFALAICGLHYTGMAAATFSYDPLGSPAGFLSLERQSMAVAVAGVAALLLGAAEAERLRRHVTKLEATQRELQVTTGNLRMALEAAAASSQAKSQFLATMSHELRTPLNAILGFSEIMKTESFGPMGNSRYAEYVADIHVSGSHLLSLINDVLDFSKSEAGHLELHEEELDVREILSESVRLIRPGAREAGIEIAMDLPSVAPPVLADRRRLKQIALNLLSNAVKFTPAGGKVSVRLSFTDRGVDMVFTDSGIGMTADQIAVALEAFGQVDNQLNRKHEGTGLGLPLCQRFVELHGGSLSIESTPCKGTSITVRLPAKRVLQSGRCDIPRLNLMPGAVLPVAFTEFPQSSHRTLSGRR